jgi:hypothetical protein
MSPKTKESRARPTPTGAPVRSGSANDTGTATAPALAAFDTWLAPDATGSAFAPSCSLCTSRRGGFLVSSARSLIRHESASRGTPMSRAAAARSRRSRGQRSGRPALPACPVAGPRYPAGIVFGTSRRPPTSCSAEPRCPRSGLSKRVAGRLTVGAHQFRKDRSLDCVLVLRCRQEHVFGSCLHGPSDTPPKGRL